VRTEERVGDSDENWLGLTWMWVLEGAVRWGGRSGDQVGKMMELAGTLLEE
jgi:hypothetical protein